MSTRKSTITKAGNDVYLLIKKTSKKISDIVGSTLGPFGSNCLNETQWGTHLTKDGASVLANLSFEDPFENAILNVIKDAVFKSNALAGDGTTSTTILINEILNATLNLVGLGYNGIQIRKGIQEAASKVIEQLRTTCKQLDDDLSNDENFKKLYNVAMISTNGDAELSDIFAKIFKACGKNANIKLETSGSADTSFKITDGYQLDFGYSSQYFVDNDDRTLTFSNPRIYVSTEPIDMLPDVMPILNYHIRTGEPVIFFAPHFDTSVVNAIVLSKVKGLKACCVKVNEARIYLMEDIAKITGSALLSSKLGMTFKTDANYLGINLFGTASSVTITENITLIVNGGGDPTALESHISGLNAQLERNRNNPDNVSMLTERLNKLKGGLAVIYIGGKTNVSTRERYDLAEDAFNACKAALATGIQPGGGVALFMMKSRIPSVSILNDIALEYGKTSAFFLGAKAFIDSLDAVFNRILANAGIDPRKIGEKLIRTTKGFVSYDLNSYKDIDQTNPIEKMSYYENEDTIKINDAEKLGVIDPELVIENEVLNAADCAGLLTSLTSITVNQKSDNSIAEAISNLT
jgi:chaperonin GroEL